MTEADAGPKGGQIFWNDALEESFKELKFMVYTYNLFNDPDLKMTFNLHTDDYGKQFINRIKESIE